MSTVYVLGIVFHRLVVFTKILWVSFMLRLDHVVIKLNMTVCLLQVEDAQAAMRLYTMHRKQWEKSLKTRLKKKSADASSNPDAVKD